MAERLQPEWPPLEAHIAGADLLGYPFTYPANYLPCIEWADKDFDAGGDGHGLTFLVRADIVRALSIVGRATHRRLVPFARGDNGDSLFCFDAEGVSGVCVIDLGEEPRRVRDTGCADFTEFINDYRARQGLQPWTPVSSRG
jgi:hypothetical protein